MSQLNPEMEIEQLQELAGRHAEYKDPKSGTKIGTIHGAEDKKNGAPGKWLIFVYSDPITGSTQKELISTGKWKHLRLLQ